MGKRFEDILDICLDHIVRDGWTVERCLETYPEHSSQLEPLLRAGRSVSEGTSVEPKADYKQALKRQVQASIHARAAESQRGRPFWTLQRGWALVAVALLVVLVGGAGTVTASSSSLPGDVLYPVKTAAERVQGFFTFGDEAKANFYMKLAERRLEEMKSLSEKDRVVPASVVRVMSSNTDRAIGVLGNRDVLDEATVTRLVDLTTDQKLALAELAQKAPAATRVRLMEALERSNESHARAVGIQANTPVRGNQNSAPSLRNAMPERVDE